MAYVRVEVVETYYGFGERRRDGRLEFIVWLDPMLRGRAPRRPTHKLLLDVELPTYGVMLIETRRVRLVPEDLELEDPRWHRPGKPEWATKLTFDPHPERDGQPAWRGTMAGEWPVKRLPIRRLTAWQRLKA